MKLFAALLTAVCVWGATAKSMAVALENFPLLHRYIGEARAKGERMTFAELVVNYSPATNNTLVVLTNVLQRLGPPPDLRSNLFSGNSNAPGTAQVIWKKDTIQWVDISNGIVRNAGTLAELHRALRQPDPNAGKRTNGLGYQMPAPNKYGTIEWLTYETFLYLHAGRLAEALDSLKTIIGLVELHREEYRIAGQVGRATTAYVALELTWEALQAKGWNDDQLKALSECWSRVDFLDAAQRAMEGERCSAWEYMNRLWEVRPETWYLIKNSAPEIDKCDNDLLLQLQFVQGFVEQIRLLRGGRSWSEASAAWDLLEEKVKRVTQETNYMDYPMTCKTFFAYRPTILYFVKEEVTRRLTLAAIAIQRSKSKYGRMPANLNELVPEFLPAVPRDCMDGRALYYKADTKSSFTLYTAGVDGRDDGGDPTRIPEETVMNAMGRDYVWPSANN